LDVLYTKRVVFLKVRLDLCALARITWVAEGNFTLYVVEPPLFDLHDTYAVAKVAWAVG
jgi:hypothetical protein